MSKITVHFNLQLLQSQVDFVDVCLDTDNELFIDPKLIERMEDPYYDQMRQTLNVFSRNLFNYVRRNQRANASRLFRGIAEPNETRLGYSSNNPRGNSLHGQLAEEFLDSIFGIGTGAMRGTLNSFGNLEFFIPRVGCDRISDTVTKIIKADLIDFTQSQCNHLGIPMQLVPQGDIYDANANDWIREDTELPVYSNGKPIIFVPKSIVRRGKDGNANLNFFFRFAFKNYIKTDDEFTRGIPKKGRDNEVTFKDFKKDMKDKSINKKELAEKVVAKYPRLMTDFRSILLNENRLHSVTDSEITAIVDSKCQG